MRDNNNFEIKSKIPEKTIPMNLKEDKDPSLRIKVMKRAKKNIDISNINGNDFQKDAVLPDMNKDMGMGMGVKSTLISNGQDQYKQDEREFNTSTSIKTTKTLNSNANKSSLSKNLSIKKK